MPGSPTDPSAFLEPQPGDAMMVRKAGGRVSAGVLKGLGYIGYLASTMPAVSQVNFNPFAFGRAPLDGCQRHGVVLEAYSPLGTGRLLSNPAVGTIAAGAGRAPAQVLLRWCVQRGVLVLSKSTHRDRIAANGQIFDVELTGEERAQRDGLDRTGGTGTVLESKWW